MKATVRNQVRIERTPRVAQLEGIFDVPPSQKSEQTWEVVLSIENRPWNIGLIVGPSGCGKSTIARQFWPEQMRQSFDWPTEKSLLDGFPKEMSIRDITEMLSSVGFSSPPAWVRPFSCLSNGEQFRVSVARALAESQDLTVIDEFTSVVDRTVAQIGSAAIAKTIRRKDKKFVAVSCHDDIEVWLQPDWIYQPHLNRFQWRELQRRPEIKLVISRVHHSAWKIFAKHHYLSSKISASAVCFAAFIDGKLPVAFGAWLQVFEQVIAWPKNAELAFCWDER